jgi:predicted nucleotidyltransferase
METTKNEMSESAKNFFRKLSDYLDTKIYYFGSIQRNDYFPNHSDIDVDIFTDNETSTISKLRNFLHVEQSEFKKIVYKLHTTDKLIYGYKVEYKDLSNNFSTEISIYNEKYKENVLLEHNYKTHIPFYVTYFLIIIKYLYYNLGILSLINFKYLKNLIINYLVEGKDCEFVTIS